MTRTDRRSWLQRYWPLLVPAGCLASVAVLVLFFSALLWALFAGIRSSWACTTAVHVARHDRRVLAELGEPIEVGWFISGTIRVSGLEGQASLRIPLHGPHGRGNLYVVAYKEAGEWYLDLLELELRGLEKRIDLLIEPGPSGAPWQVRLSRSLPRRAARAGPPGSCAAC